MQLSTPMQFLLMHGSRRAKLCLPLCVLSACVAHTYVVVFVLRGCVDIARVVVVLVAVPVLRPNVLCFYFIALFWCRLVALHGCRTVSLFVCLCFARLGQEASGRRYV
jgi:glycerol-3-phosphate acyltransferase PlsY